MFYQNDRALRTTRIIIMIIIGIFAGASLAMGITLAIIVHPACFLLTFAGLLFCWLMWVFASLYLSYLCDIKLIRNKLYGEDNDGLEVFLKSHKERENAFIVSEKKAEIEEAKLALDELLKNDMISQEEYESQKQDLIDKEKDLRNQ